MNTLSEKLETSQLFETSLLDGPQGVIGAPLPRVEGPLKVSGKATYTAEFEVDNLAYGYLVLSTVPKARVTGVDEARSRAVKGLIEIYRDAKFLPYSNQPGETDSPEAPHEQVIYAGQPLALVVAETYEAAREAGELLRFEYDEQPAELAFDGREDQAKREADDVAPAYIDQGDIEQAMRDAEVTLDVIYTTPSQNSAAMEPHATIAQWQGDKLVVHSSLQMLSTDHKQLAKALDMEKENIRLLAPYVGGGFGSKLFISPGIVASAIAAKALGRPVKTVLTRQQVFQCTVRRSNTRQRVRLGAGRDGKLIAMGHDTFSSNVVGHGFFEPAGIATQFLYAGKHRHIHHDVIHSNIMLAGSMRAPGEGSGALALECAMDEMAQQLGLDPIEFRKRNEPERDPGKDVPFSSRKLVQCMEEGAERFGWSERSATPGQHLEGEWLVGMGMAAAARGNLLMASQARVILTSKGTAVVETDMTDIGTGTYTILAQIAGEVLGLDISSVEVKLGDTAFPPASGSGGSFGASSAGSSVYLACEAIRKELAKKLGCKPDELVLKDGTASAGDCSKSLAELAGDGISAEGSIKPGENKKNFTQAGFGAHFAEVAVNAVTGEVRVRRMLGVFAAGRILNAKTARSQCLGGMTFGIGAALEEAIIHDPRTNKVVNHDLAEYHVPVNADIPQLEVHFIEERDTAANPMQSKGIGELAISGAGAAIANAIHNACGVRVRDYPLTLDKLLDGLPPI